MQRWEETVAWADRNECSNLLTGMPDDDFYFVEKPSNLVMGVYREWDFKPKPKPSGEEIARYLEALRARWADIAGPELGQITRPLRFTGRKTRRLLVLADYSRQPPWGGWSRRAQREAERRTFTSFRAAINNAIAPHEVDHIDFVADTSLGA